MEPMVAARPGSGSGADRRDQILVEAVRLFRVRGYDRTSLREIAAALGLSKSGLYHHFPSKDALLASLVDPLLDDLTGLLRETPEDLSEPARSAFLTRYLDILLSHRSVVSLIGREPAVAAHARIGTSLGEVNAALRRRLAGPDPDLSEEVRTVHALAGLQDAVARFADADPAVVRRASLAAATAALSGR
ncbi:MAG: TetR/AcrR family transcriptional regulator [Mycobacteriales bacterium]